MGGIFNCFSLFAGVLKPNPVKIERWLYTDSNGNAVPLQAGVAQRVPGS